MMKRTLCTTLFLAVALSACDSKSDDGKAQAENAAASSVASSQESAPAASSQKAVDVYQLDIAGVRLGMSWDEATAAVKEKMQLTDKDIEPEPYPDKDEKTGEKIPAYFSVKHGHGAGNKMTVRFRPDYLHGQPEKRVVSSVDYQKERGAKEDGSEMFKAAEEKYGEPVRMTGNEGSGTVFYIWCGDDCGIDSDPTLSLVKSTFFINLRLDDPRYENAIKEQERKDNPPKF
ncbi:hypothetical protein [Cardiobacterium valvarum]|nr:hypothetical protein [Cardiobacterium valvarum]